MRVTIPRPFGCRPNALPTELIARSTTDCNTCVNICNNHSTLDEGDGTRTRKLGVLSPLPLPFGYTPKKEKAGCYPAFSRASLFRLFSAACSAACAFSLRAMICALMARSSRVLRMSLYAMPQFTAL